MKRQSKQILFQWERRYSDAKCKSMREVLNQQESRSVQSQDDKFVRFLVCYRSEYWRKESDTVAVWYLFHENTTIRRAVGLINESEVSGLHMCGKLWEF